MESSSVVSRLRLVGRQVLQQSKLDAIARDAFDARQPHAIPVAQFVELARLRAQHAAQMMRRSPSMTAAVPLNFSTKNRRRTRGFYRRSA